MIFTYFILAFIVLVCLAVISMMPIGTSTDYYPRPKWIDLARTDWIPPFAKMNFEMDIEWGRETELKYMTTFGGLTLKEAKRKLYIEARNRLTKDKQYRKQCKNSNFL